MTDECRVLTDLLIDELQLHGIALRVHIDGYVSQTPGLILREERALCRETRTKQSACAQCRWTETRKRRALTAGRESSSLYPLGEWNVPGKYLLNLRLYCPGSHSAARELHAAPGPLFCGSLKYFLIFALQITKYRDNHPSLLKKLLGKYTASSNISVFLIRS